ncbi:MAG: hypothetical protein IJZ30_05455 [Alphaproteobacteria bacterium]|nr:hypothetical protein [Alphaproteobacteria bacterium]
MSEDKRNIKWETSVMELPDDVSFEGCRDRLNRPDEYKSDKLFAYDCWKISEHAVNSNSFAGDVLEIYDILLERGVPERVENDICQGLGKMVKCNPELRDSVVELGVKHHPLFEKNLENYNHLYTDEIESMQGDIHKRLEEKNKDILGNVKEKLGKANKYYKPSENKVTRTVDDMDEKFMNICRESLRQKE